PAGPGVLAGPAVGAARVADAARRAGAAMTARHMNVRRMSGADLAAVLGWAADEGWNPGLADAGPFVAADPRGFFLAEVGGQPAAAISVVNHDDGFAFLGLYICRPAFRGQGVGHALWREALAHAGDR